MPCPSLRRFLEVSHFGGFLASAACVRTIHLVVKRRLLLIVLLALGGCAPASTTPGGGATTAAAVPSEADLAEARAQTLAALRATNRELSVQLGLAQAESGELRDELAALREDEARRVTLIANQPTACQEPEEPPAPAEPRASGPRPVLRLYGTAPASSRPAGTARGVATLAGPDAPSWVGPPPAGTVRLPVVATSPGGPAAGVPAIPVAPVQVRGGAEAPAAPRPAARTRADDAVTEQYRTALRHLTERRISQATADLERFAEEHPTHPYADNAMYWRAEIDSTRRDYSAALSRFSLQIERFPRGNKVPDALLRIGLCYEQMGQRSRARRVFSRLRQQFPNTVAARMASREDA